jgi:riboflavin synthase alpha subunit
MQAGGNRLMNTINVGDKYHKNGECVTVTELTETHVKCGGKTYPLHEFYRLERRAFENGAVFEPVDEKEKIE